MSYIRYQTHDFISFSNNFINFFFNHPCPKPTGYFIIFEPSALFHIRVRTHVGICAQKKSAAKLQKKNDIYKCICQILANFCILLQICYLLNAFFAYNALLTHP